LALVRLSALAADDIVAILARTEEAFGEAARVRYEALLTVCLGDIATNPLCLGSAARPEIGEGIRTYHLRHGRSRVQSGGRVRKPRHFLLYRALSTDIVDVGRGLHDAMDVVLHLPPAYGEED
jgi:toxin ParE1/3/4